MAADPIERAHFRTTPDGVLVFFPWNLSGRGYALRDASQKARIRRGVGLMYGLAITTSAVAFGVAQQHVDVPNSTFADFVWLVAVSILPSLVCFGLYGLWVLRLVEGLAPSDFRVPRAEVLAEAARKSDPREQRKGLLAGLALVAVAFAVAWIDPSKAWIAGVAIGLMLVIAGLWLRVRHAVREVERNPRQL